MHVQKRLALGAATLLLSLANPLATAQDLEAWDFQRMRSARDCDTQSKTNFMRLMAYQAVENRKIDQMNIPPAQKRQLGYEVYRDVQDRNRDEERMAEQCKQYMEAKEEREEEQRELRRRR